MFNRKRVLFCSRRDNKKNNIIASYILLNTGKPFVDVEYVFFYFRKDQDIIQINDIKVVY